MRFSLPQRAVNPFISCLASLGVVWSLAVAAIAGERPFTIDDMLRVAMVDDVRIASDGKRAVFTVTRAVPDAAGGELRSRIYMADVGKGTARPVTSEREVCDKPRLSPDGTKLAYFVQGDDTVSLMLLNLRTGQARRLPHGRGEVVDMAFSPDGRSLALAVAAPNRAGDARGNENDADVEVLDEGGGAIGLYLLSLSGASGPQALVADRDVGAFAFSPDGTRIAFETTAPDTPPRGRRTTTATGAPSPMDAAHADIAVVSVPTGKASLLASTEASENAPCFSPDGKQLAYVGTASPGQYFNAATVMVMPAAGGPPRALAQTANARPDLLGWAADGQALYVREAEGVSGAIWALPVNGDAPRRVSDASHVVAEASLSFSGNVLGMVLTDSNQPPEVFVSETGRFAPRAVSSVNKEFLGFRTGRTEVVRWRSTDGKLIEGLYTYPVTPPQGPPPLLVEIHGGPAVASDRQYLGRLNYYPLAVFVENGYALFQPNVRGSDGYGPAFRRGNIGDWGGADFADLQSGVDALVERGLADPKRLGIMGWSYGGYLTAWAIGHTTRFRAASIGAGITDLVSQCGSMDLPDFIPLYFGGEVYERFDLLLDRSPLKYAASITTPTLFQHGIADERVPFTQSLELYTALSRLGVTTRLAVYPRSGHDVTEPSLIRDLMVRNLEWFARYLPTTPMEHMALDVPEADSQRLFKKGRPENALPIAGANGAERSAVPPNG